MQRNATQGNRYDATRQDKTMLAGQDNKTQDGEAKHDTKGQKKGHDKTKQDKR
jgi:hypothetical protein